MQRCVRGAVGQIQKERLIGVDLLLLGDEADRVVGQVFGQVIAGFEWRFDVLIVVGQMREPLIRFAADKAIKPLEAHPQRPAIERAGIAVFVEIRLMPLADVERAVTALLQDLGDRRLALAASFRRSPDSRSQLR